MSKIQAMFNSRGRHLLESERPAVDALYAKYVSVASEGALQPPSARDESSGLTFARYVAPDEAEKTEQSKRLSVNKRARRPFRGTRLMKSPKKVLVTKKTA